MAIPRGLLRLGPRWDIPTLTPTVFIATLLPDYLSAIRTRRLVPYALHPWLFLGPSLVGLMSHATCVLILSVQLASNAISPPSLPLTRDMQDRDMFSLLVNRPRATFCRVCREISLLRSRLLVRHKLQVSL